mmetsp:Transcript_45165/g.105982  ORF Transcript_45165/g.105982 Transcript_45165/m.105982 type:complete len:258 (-) Transcript_45165:268-1041(-)
METKTASSSTRRRTDLMQQRWALLRRDSTLLPTSSKTACSTSPVSTFCPKNATSTLSSPSSNARISAYTSPRAGIQTVPLSRAGMKTSTLVQVPKSASFRPRHRKTGRTSAGWSPSLTIGRRYDAFSNAWTMSRFEPALSTQPTSVGESPTKLETSSLEESASSKGMASLPSPPPTPSPAPSAICTVPIPLPVPPPIDPRFTLTSSPVNAVLSKECENWTNTSLPAGMSTVVIPIMPAPLTDRAAQVPFKHTPKGPV